MKKVAVIRGALLAAAAAMIVLGVLDGGAEEVFAKAAAVCAECIGLG